MVEKRHREEEEVAESGTSKSILTQSAEMSFPRGGDSVLTPLEIKEVSNKAKSDVLFEQKSVISGHKKKRARKSKVRTADEKDTEDNETVDSVSFKILQPGSFVLGRISHINKMEIVLSLSDNLEGYIPITNLSDEVSKTLSVVDDEDDDDDESSSDDDEESSIPSLSSLFTIGQYLRAIVTENTSDTGKKRLELSIEPSKVNEGMEKDDFCVNTIVQASVKSVEDHGAILNVGHSHLSGFISKKELPSSVDVGSVLLVVVSKKSGRTITVKLPTETIVKKLNTVQSATNVNAILPGMLVDAAVLNVFADGIIVKALNLCNGSISCMHLGFYELEQLKHRFSTGSQIKARIIASYMKNGQKKVMLSILPHILTLSQFAYDPEKDSDPLEAFPIGHIFDEVIVKGKDSHYIFIDVGSRNAIGQVFKTRVSENADLDMDFKIGSVHKARVLDYSSFDNIYILTMDKAQINQKYLRIEDLPTGQLIHCKVEKLVPGKGVQVRIENEFNGFVPSIHMSDIHLAYPERKFKIGSKFNGRVLRVSTEGRRPSAFVSLKKSLVRIENEDEVVKSMDDAVVGKKAPATIERFYPGGCLVSFFGDVRGFLPISEMSETYVKKAEDHVKLGQTVRVTMIDVDKEKDRIRVSLRASSTISESQTDALEDIVLGKTIVEAHVVERNKDCLILELPPSGVRAILPYGQVSDENYENSRARMKKISVGSTVKVVALSKDHKGRFVNVSCKPSILKDAEAGKFPSSYSEVAHSHELLHGWVKNVNTHGVFVSFADELTGLILPRFISEDMAEDLEKNFFVGQSIACKVVDTDDAHERFLLSMREDGIVVSETAVNPVDKSVKLLNEFVPGKTTKGIIKTVQPTQLTVKLADNQLGRLDKVDIADTEKSFSDYKTGDVLNVRVVGYFDSLNRTHNFVPNRDMSDTTIKLSMKKNDVVSIEDLEEGQEVTAFVSRVSEDAIYVDICPQVKGKVSMADLNGEALELDDLDQSYPVGSALQLVVKSVDKESSLVKLSAKEGSTNSFESIKVGTILPGKVFKVEETYVLVDLGHNIEAMSYITDALDDYSKTMEDTFSINQKVMAKVTEIDTSNGRIFVSLKTKDVKDRLIEKSEDIKVGDVLRGIISNISDKGVFVAFSRKLFAFVRVSDLSDSFLRDWKSFFKLYQPVIGKIVHSGGAGKIMMSLRESDVSSKGGLKRFEDLKVGDIFNGSIKRVVDFGVFVKLDGTVNITGLCHHSQISDNRIDDVASIFAEGDRVKVKIMEINLARKQLSLGMKASFFKEVDDDKYSDEETASVGGEDGEDVEMSDDNSDEDNSDEDIVDGNETLDLPSNPSQGLSAGFDWTASILEQAKDDVESDDDEYDENLKKKKKRSKLSTAVEDKTAEINTRAPESVSDFERLLVGNPDSSILWIQYMSFQLQLGEVDKARELGKRALKTINYREEQEKLNIWIAMLNMESMFGTDESLEKIFKKSCKYMEPYAIHQKLVAICVASEKFDKASELYRVMCKKFGYDHVPVWVSYGSFLIDRDEADEAHKVLSNALQILPKRSHVEVVRRFAQMEFDKGDSEQGRSLFEGLLSDVPKRLDLWNVYIDQEIKNGDKKKAESLFERVSARKLTKKQAKFFFGKWLAFEEKEGDSKAGDYVKAKAVEYAQKLVDKQ
ncbi:hypothetical protein FOA43_002163 [Brettanomyces nanus]|uniref:rRNA biogenesis protein RRP5 n=1 Tax=Eeniella nana TaxID=13502 RepID=A0A875RUQ2_EENNA|nr:uncharacterized protein FOA43_002163 [Brettanomyces nanus]QPG74827.1 hypothetical protein FOA43_002163 [Brettanomyces nanus]